jgi:carboxyl-terminal processing protease
VFLDRQVLAAFVPPNNVPADAAPSFELMAEAWNTIAKVYVDQSAVEPTQLAYGAIGGMVDALGDTGHSRFLTPDMLQQQHEFTQGQFEGIGAEVQMKDGHVVIVAPMDGSPAETAGLRPGDVILAVDSQDVTGLSLEQTVQRIVGPAGTPVTLTVLDPGTNETRDVTMVRAEIPIHNVVWEQVPGTDVAHVRIAAFSKGVTDDLRQALGEIQDQQLGGIILDLRNDPGGLLSEAVGVASQFLSDGNVVLERDAQGNQTAIPVEPGALAPDTPLVVLTNAGTASAAEIVAGALQDAGRATVVGETTFGTGTVLQEYGLSDGSALLLANEEWLTPNGRLIWHQGITPDEVVQLSPDATPLTPRTERDMTADQVQASSDQQVLRALAILLSRTT